MAQKPPGSGGILARAQALGPSQPTSQSATERFDEFKKKQVMASAEAEVRLKPEDSDSNRALVAAMTLEEAYGLYRKALRALRVSVDKKLEPGAAGFIAEAATRIPKLRELKALVDEDFAADGRDTGANMQALIETSLAILDAKVGRGP